MNKLAVLLVMLLAVGFVNAKSITLDRIHPGSMEDWTIYNSGYNPAFSYGEITSPYDEGVAIKTSVSGNTVMYCDTKYVHRTFDVGTQYSDLTELKAYLEFWYDGTYYNLPYVAIQLLDSEDNILGTHVWYGKGVVGGYYQNVIANDPASFTELPSDKGYFSLDFSDFGDNIKYSKVRVYIDDYTCIGNNYVIFDELSLYVEGSSDDDTPVDPIPEVPEFGVMAGAIALIIALGIFTVKKQ